MSESENLPVQEQDSKQPETSIESTEKDEKQPLPNTSTSEPVEKTKKTIEEKKPKPPIQVKFKLIVLKCLFMVFM